MVAVPVNTAALARWQQILKTAATELRHRSERGPSVAARLEDLAEEMDREMMKPEVKP